MFTNARKKQKRLGGTSIVVSLRCKFSPNILQAIYIKIALRIKHHQQGRTSGIRPHPAFDSTTLTTLRWSGSLRSSHQTRSRPKFVFIFGAENGLFGHFRIFFVFGRKWIFFVVLFFVFVPKMSFALGRKCYVRN